jgi:hypothetical protein
MRWYILKTLLHKEALRHLANRGGLVFLVLLVVFAMLLSFFGNNPNTAGGLTAGVQRCYVDYWRDGPLVDHLRRHVPAEFEGQVRFRPVERVPTGSDGAFVYAQGTGAIQLRPLESDPDGFRVWFWHPGDDGGALAPYEAWFWKETLAFFRDAQRRSGGAAAGREALLLPAVEAKRSKLDGAMDARSGLATALVLFGLFFVCVYLLPSLTCEERERGVLLAQVLSPASPREILAAKFLFYPALGLFLGALLAGLYRPGVLTHGFFWLALAVAVFGSMGIGLTIASLARTQRAASMGAMGYTLAVALLLMICQQCGVPFVSYLALEYHCPRMLHAALTGPPQLGHWAHLAGAAVLACVWAALAATLFRRRGWQ